LLIYRSKHRNGHLKPLKCPEPDCSKTFSQQQAVDRHSISIHKSAADSATIYYHCTTDGCRYASNCRNKRRFARLDQLKEHIKEYGHYGPHSPSDRMKRPGKSPVLPFTDVVVPYFIEVWTPIENSQPLRIIKAFEFNSKTRNLRYADDTGEEYLQGSSQSLNSGYECGMGMKCYYSSACPISTRTIFKTLKACQDHENRCQPLFSLPPSAQNSSLTLQIMDNLHQFNHNELVAAGILCDQPSTAMETCQIPSETSAVRCMIEHRLDVPQEMNQSISPSYLQLLGNTSNFAESKISLASPAPQTLMGLRHDSLFSIKSNNRPNTPKSCSISPGKIVIE